MSTINSEKVFGDYSRIPGTYDNMWESDGNVRNAWFSLLNNIQSLGPAELKNRYQEIQKILKENGVTYNVYGDPAGIYRSWKLDAVPNIIGSEEWAYLSEGLKQRANLLNLILKDIYGSRDLIKNGMLPLDLIHNHNGFLRPCNGISIPGNNQLILFAVDIARDKSGNMWVMNDRTQAPSGSGYALENRGVMQRIMPDLFYGYNVSRLNQFFNHLHKSLLSLAPNQNPNPNIVLLTPGPGNETYFEHSFLASYLGYSLVQGEDLTVRKGIVWLKTIEGLKKVDIILRRVDDVFCDPLELRSDSRLGIPGLLEAVRQGNVVVANPLGSNILENPGLMAFLPGLCKYYFKEDLILPSLGTWWCGQPKELNYVLDNLNYLKIKLIHPKEGSRTVSEGKLSARQKEHLTREIKEKPYLYVAHEQIGMATSPAWVNTNLDRRYSILRCFLVATENGYEIMPGGLTRSSSDRDVYKISNQYGGISKDTWVLDQVSGFNVAPVEESPESDIKDSSFLSSRTVENMFWAGRYVARAKITARYIREILQKLIEQKDNSVENNEALKLLLSGLSHLTIIYPGFVGSEAREKFKKPSQEIQNILLSTEETGSLSSCLQYFKRCVYSVRHKWTSDTWHVVDNIENSWIKLEHDPLKSPRVLLHTLENVIDSAVAFLGLNLEGIPRDHGYIMLNLGRRIEKALLLISQMRSLFSVPQDRETEYQMMESVLSGNMSLNIYRSKYRSYLKITSFFDLMLFDPLNPSSLIHQLEQIKGYLGSLPRSDSSRLGPEEKTLLDAYTSLQMYTPAQLVTTQEGTFVRKDFEDLLSGISESLFKISNLLVAAYFTHSEMSQQLNTADSEF